MPHIDLGASAQKLARNPLGIIALFLLLVYGIAGLVFRLAAKNLSATERQPLIWFLVAFPALVLIMFAWLVARHHTKLYSPADYHDAEGFFRALTPTEQRARLAAEVEELQTQIVEGASPSSPRADSSSSADSDRRRDVPPKSGAVSFASQKRPDLHAAVALAEDLAFRELSAEFGAHPARHVRIPGDIEVDGVFQIGDQTIAVEIKYIRAEMNWSSLVREAVVRANVLTRATWIRRWRFLFAVVADRVAKEEREKLRKQLVEQSSTCAIEVRVYDFTELQQKFGIAPA
jgi:hypothetical protein